MTYVAYLDEFGHIGPYAARDDPKHNDSPVFGLAGLVLPINEIRSFGTWFYQRKYELLESEIRRSGKEPETWEKKGSALYTVRNIEKYPELRKFTNRFLKKISDSGGFTFYVGIEKTHAPEQHQPNILYRAILREAVKRLDESCLEDCVPPENFFIVMDEHDQRTALVNEAARSMYDPQDPRRSLIEPPFQAESHRYQTLQAADWIAGLVGRLGAMWKDPNGFPENIVIRKYFENRLHVSSRRSGIR